MQTTSQAFYNQAKRILMRVPGMHLISGNLRRIILLRELSSLIKENRFAILHPYFKMGNEKALTCEIVHDVVKDFLYAYGTVRLGRKTSATINSLEGSILLFAPLALLRIPSTHEEYLEQVGNKTRNMIRKAERNGYEFREFNWDDHLDEIFEINTSKEVRQSGIMRGWYREPVNPRYHSKEEQQYRKYYGAFKDGKLYAYLHIVLCGDFAFFRHFLGHAQHLTYGIMNGLVSWTVREYIGNPQIRWLKYGTLSKELTQMHSFRKHAGFQGYATLLDIENDQELLKYSEHLVKTWWRV